MENLDNKNIYGKSIGWTLIGRLEVFEIIKKDLVNKNPEDNSLAEGSM